MSYASGSVGAKNRPVKCNIFFFRVRKDFKIKVFLGFFWSFSDAFRLSYCIFIHYLNDVEKKKMVHQEPRHSYRFLLIQVISAPDSILPFLTTSMKVT